MELSETFMETIRSKREFDPDLIIPVPDYSAIIYFPGIIKPDLLYTIIDNEVLPDLNPQSKDPDLSFQHEALNN